MRSRREREDAYLIVSSRDTSGVEAEISAVYSALSAPPLRVSVYLDFLRDTIGAGKPGEAGAE